MTITLKIDGEDKIFVNDFVSGMMFRKALVLYKSINEEISEELLDKMANFVCEAFLNQFTLDEFYNGIAADKLIFSILDVLMTCINKKKSNEEEKN